MSELALEVKGPHGLVDVALKLAHDAGGRAGKPKRVDGVTDGFDAPINGADIKEALTIASLILGNVSTLLVIAKAVRDLLKQPGKPDSGKFVVSDARSRKTILVVSAGATDAELEAALRS